MSSRRSSVTARLRRWTVLPVSAVAILGLVVLTAAAAARTFALATASHATVRNTSGQTAHETIVVTRGRRAVYTLTGDSRRHPECTARSGCFSAWPPVTVRSGSAAKPASIHGRLTTWRRGKILQLVLDGHPLYTFAGDTSRDAASGEGIRSFGGTWHVLRPAGTRAVTPSSTASPAPPSGTSAGSAPQAW